jgi:Putative beta-barrel porin-2, OmpL-like. bbp2
MRTFLFLAGATLVAVPAQGQDSAKASVSFGAFVDAYYAYDFGKPASIDRFYTTQPARHNEFNVNLAFVDARLSHDRLRGRFALQAGTSVQANYFAEPTIGTISGGDLSRHIQEAYAGVRLAQGLWVDGGIFYSHIGQESWASRDNPTYTRSFIADYTPYYSTGVKFIWQASAKLAVHLHLVNGWQNISETNSDKSAGLRLEFAPSPQLLLGYSNVIGNELPDSVPSHVRFFNQGFAKATLGKTVWWLTVDYGMQDTDAVDGASWFGTSFIGQLQASSRVALSARVERYSDPDQVIIATGLPYGFATWAGSVGLDVKVAEVALWRVELRGMRGDDPLWPDGGGAPQHNGGFVVTSLGLSF